MDIFLYLVFNTDQPPELKFYENWPLCMAVDGMLQNKHKGQSRMGKYIPLLRIHFMSVVGDP